jgi:glyoxylase-like metal-dependent hydrolase (beta-lactamase superfamily II)
MSLTFKAGDMTIHRVIEDETTFRTVPQFFGELPKEVLTENRAWLQQIKALDADDVLRICFQSYVVRTPHHTILIDTCVGNDKSRSQWPAWHMRKSDTYMRALAAHGLSVGDIDYVMCTHLHVDHVGWNTKLENGRWVPTFPKARYVFAKQEYDYWAGLHAQKRITVFEDSVLPVAEAGRAELVANEHQLGDHVRLLPTPGHTPGHVAIRFGKGRDEAVMSGDLMHSPLQTRYPDISPVVDVDPLQSAKTRRSFMERYCDTATLCCTAHFPSPSVGRIKRRGNGFECEMVAG